MQRVGVRSSYAMVTASALWPVAAAAQAGDWSALVALGGAMGGSVGANLIANQIQKWKDEADGVRQLEALSKDDPIRAHLDTVLEKLEAFAEARTALPEPDREWFVQTLRAELGQLGNLARFEVQITGDRGVVVLGPMDRSLISTGDHNQLTNIGSVKALVIQSPVFLSPPSPGQVSPKVLLWTYLNRVIHDTGTLDLSGLDPKAAIDDKMKEKARLALASVYTALDTVLAREREAHKRYASMFSRRPQEGEEPQRLSAIAFASSSPAVALLGDPGSGKTTFANYLGLCLAGELLGLEAANLRHLGKDWTCGPLLPVRVVLRQFAAELPATAAHEPGDNLWNHIAGHLGTALAEFVPLLRKHLLTEGGIVLLDGLDEVPEAHQQRQRVKEVVLNFQTQFPRVRVLVTSRTYAYQKQEWRLPGFAEAVLAPFTTEQIESFVDRWYDFAATARPNLTPTDAQGRAALLKQTIRREPHLRELAARPLLLTLMASLHAWRGGTLPEQREQLYEESIELLLDLWQRPKIGLDQQGQPKDQDESVAAWLATSRDGLLKELERLVCEIHRTQAELTGAANIPEDALTAALSKAGGPDCKPERVKEYIRDRAGLFIHRAEGVYCLPHRSLQEYLAARHLTGDGFPNRLVGLLRADIERWREVVLLAAAKAVRGAAYSGWSLVDKLCPTDCDDTQAPSVTDADWWITLLAGQILVETRIGLSVPADQADAAKRRRIVAWLMKLVDGGHLPVADRAQAGIVLGKLGDLRDGVRLKEGLLDVADFIPLPGGKFKLGETGQPAEVSPFRLSRYPVTVAQFQAFVDNHGYEQDEWWTPAGKAWRDGKVKPEVLPEWLRDEYRKEVFPITRPRDYDPVFQTPNHPRVGVSWFEAKAFCLWLTERLRQHGALTTNQEIRLPHEAEWEQAARWNELESKADARFFPWGGGKNDTDRAQRCNISKTGIGHTSAVGLFPDGKANCGAMDLAGNVWEWCENLYRPDNEWRVVRGGSWYVDGPGDLRCSSRCSCPPIGDGDGIGFRCVVVGVSAPQVTIP